MGIKIQKVINFLGSKWVFGATTLIFTAETTWLAVTSRFPMPFDESYHLGMIQFFSHHLNPIITSQPPDSYRFGAIIQNPSWLYHYLMSFPYRLIELFTHDLAIQVIGLRLIDVGLMIVNLFILRKLLRLVRLSDSLTNVVLLIFALTPMVTVLSAQISYDNLFILLTTLSIYETILMARELNRQYFNVRRFLGLLSICLFASLVKFAFLPILLAITVVITWKLATYLRADRAKMLSQISASFSNLSVFTKAFLLIMTVLSVFLFVRFYGVNTVKYHDPVPRCNQLLSKKDCLHYYSWYLSYSSQQYARTHSANIEHLNVGQYTGGWLITMSEHPYSAVTPLKPTFYVSPLLYIGVLIFLVISFDCTVVNFKKIIHKNRGLLLVLFVSLVYILFLWGRNYWEYLHVGQPLAVSGRYLIPILAYIYAVLGLGMSYSLRSGRAVIIKVVLALALVTMFISLGGFVQYVTHVTPNYGHLNDDNDFVLPSSW